MVLVGAGRWARVALARRLRLGTAVALLLSGVGCGSADEDDASNVAPFPGTVTEFAVDRAGCLDTELTLEGLTPACRLVEAIAPEAALSCLVNGRAPLDGPADASLEAELRTRLETQMVCSGGACHDYLFCEMVRLAGKADAIATCAADPTVTSPLYCACLNVADTLSGPSGYCYLDPAADIGQPGATACDTGPALRFLESAAVPLPAPSSPRLFEVCE